MVVKKKGPGRPRKKAAPAKRENLECPFTGKEIQLVRTANGAYMGRVGNDVGGYTTRLFPGRQELVYFLSCRGGVEPEFPQSDTIKVSEREEPATDPLKDVKAKAEAADEAIKNIPDHIINPGG